MLSFGLIGGDLGGKPPMPLIQYDFNTLLNVNGFRGFENIAGDHNHGIAYGSNHVALGVDSDSGTAYVDLDSNAFFTYTDTATNNIITQVDGNATFTMTTSFQMAFATDAPVTEADITAMEADRELIFRVWFDKTGLTTLPSGLDYSNIKHFYPGVDWNSGAYIQDIAVDFGAEEVEDNSFDTGTGWLFVGTDVSISGGKLIFLNSGAFDQAYRTDMTNNTNGKIFIFECEISSISVGTVGLAIGNTLILGSTNTVLNKVGVHTYVFMLSNASNTNFNLQNSSSDAVIEWSSLKEATAAEIQDYAELCRTKYLNTNKGTSVLPIECDGSGRPLRVADDNTIAVDASGKYVETMAYPNLDTYSIEQVSELNTEKLTHTPSGDEYYIDDILQGFVPELPNPNITLKLNNVNLNGEEITEIRSDFLAAPYVLALLPNP